MAAMRRLLQQAALRHAPHSRRLHSPFPLSAASASPPAPAPASHSPSPTPSLLPRSTGSLLPTSAGAVAAAARTDNARNAGSLDEPLSVQKKNRTSDCFASSSSTLLHGVAAPWAHWTTTPADDIVLMLAGANVAVYGLWRLADPNFALGPSMVSGYPNDSCFDSPSKQALIFVDEQQIWLDTYTGGRLHTLLTNALSHVDPRFMGDHFMISLDNFKSLRLHTLLTCAFSHKDANHLSHNMIGLYFFGSSIARTFGPDFLLKLYVQGALLGSAFYLTEMAFLAPQKQGFGGWNTPALVIDLLSYIYIIYYS
ncbi:hypothetical protein ACQ4PT_061889 [Festuca glaucescens]